MPAPAAPDEPSVVALPQPPVLRPVGGDGASGSLTTPARIRRATLRSRGLRVRVRCSTACRVRAGLWAGRRRVGTASARLTAAGARPLHLRPRRPVRARVLRLRVTFTGPDGSTRTVRRTVAIV